MGSFVIFISDCQRYNKNRSQIKIETVGDKFMNEFAGSIFWKFKFSANHFNPIMGGAMKIWITLFIFMKKLLRN